MLCPVLNLVLFWLYWTFQCHVYRGYQLCLLADYHCFIDSLRGRRGKESEKGRNHSRARLSYFIDSVEGNFILITERVEVAFIDSVGGKKHHSTVKPVSLRVSVTRKLCYNFHHSVKMETKQPCLSKFTVCRRQAAPPDFDFEVVGIQNMYRSLSRDKFLPNTKVPYYKRKPVRVIYAEVVLFLDYFSISYFKGQYPTKSPVQML